METINKHAAILDAVISGLRSESNDIHRMAEGKAEQNALAKIANRLHSMAESLESIRRELNEGNR